MCLQLQLAFARNELKPGLNIPLEKPREFVNDQVNRKHLIFIKIFI